MNSITALLLSLILMFSAANYSGPAAVPAEQTQKPAAQTSVAAEATLPANSYVRSIPSTLGKIVASPKAETKVGVIRSASIMGSEWSYITVGDVRGWVPAAELKKPAAEPAADEETPIPAWVKWGIVNTQTLNIRKGVGVNTERIGFYSYGNRVPIIEYNGEWGRTNKGWIYLGYVYMEGAMGENYTEGTVAAERLAARKGPGTSYAVNTYLNYGEPIEVLEQFYLGGSTWGYTIYGWVNMAYVQEYHVPSGGIIATAVVTRNGVPVYALASPNNVVDSLNRGDLVYIYQVEYKDGVTWARLYNGWVMADFLEFGDRPVDPTEPETEPTDPVTEATEPIKPEPEVTEPVTEPATEPVSPAEPTPEEPTPDPDPSPEA